MYRYSFLQSISVRVDLVQFTVAWNKAKKLKVGGRFPAQDQLATACTGQLVHCLADLLVAFSPPHRANSFLRSKQERPGRQRSYKTRIMGEGDRFETMGRTLQTP